MNQLLFIETFVLGASTIAAIYHLVLYIQQRDKFLMYYSVYLFTLASYILFKILSNNYDPFKPTDNIVYYILEEVIQVTMVAVYVLFAAQTLEVVNEKSRVRSLMYCFFGLAFLSIVYHIYDAIANGTNVKSIQSYAIGRISLVGVATIALLFAWRIRTTIFQRTIIIGSLVYDTSGLLSIISFAKQGPVFGLTGVEPYLAGCLVDIIIFSSALGYRLKIIAEQKNQLLKRETEARLAVEKTRMRIAINLHDDVGSVLSSMSVYGEAAKRSLAENNLTRVNELLDKVGVNARETMSNMSDIVWTINPVNDTGEKLFNKMEAFASEVLDAAGIEFEFKVDEMLYKENFLMPVRQNIFYIFKEAVNNCVKHSVAKKFGVHLSIKNNLFEMKIRDDGKGFDPDKKYEGNGLKNMRQRAQESNDTLDVYSSENGTVIKLTCHTMNALPLHPANKN